MTYKAAWKSVIKGIVLSVLSSIIITYVYVSTYLSDYSPFPLVHPLLYFFAPLLCSMAVGVLLKDFEMLTMLYAALFMTFISVCLFLLVLMSPSIAGIPGYATHLTITGLGLTGPLVAFILPFTIIGAFLGKIVGEYIFLTEEEKVKHKALVEETKRWHSMLSKSDVKTKTGTAEKSKRTAMNSKGKRTHGGH